MLTNCGDDDDVVVAELYEGVKRVLQPAIRVVGDGRANLNEVHWDEQNSQRTCTEQTCSNQHTMLAMFSLFNISLN